MWFSKKCQKLLNFDNVLWPNHLTKPKDICWHPGILNWPTCWVTVTLWKSWPTLGDGKKWVIRSHLLACPWTCSTNTFVPTPGFCNWMQNFTFYSDIQTVVVTAPFLRSICSSLFSDKIEVTSAFSQVRFHSCRQSCIYLHVTTCFYLTVFSLKLLASLWNCLLPQH